MFNSGERYVYIIKNEAGVILYIGQTTTPRQRIQEHYRNQPWASEIDAVEWLDGWDSPEAATEAEYALIKKLGPKYNKRRNLPRTAATSPNGFSKRIKQLRQQRGWSQQKLAQQSRLSLMAVSKVEIGRVQNPTLPTLRALSRALDVGVEELID